MSARVGLRYVSQSSRQSALRTPFNTRQTIFRRGQTTAANPAVEAPQQSFLKRIWTSEVGVKTVHFWAPVMKWGVVLAGASDFLRPAEKLSITQNMALMATGSIWTRWCFVIRPQNMLLAAVNFCLFWVGFIQCSRIFMYNKELTGSTSGAFSNIGAQLTGSAKKVEKDVKSEVKELEQKATA